MTETHVHDRDARAMVTYLAAQLPEAEILGRPSVQFGYTLVEIWSN